jgi:hypothetical protein
MTSWEVRCDRGESFVAYNFAAEIVLDQEQRVHVFNQEDKADEQATANITKHDMNTRKRLVLASRILWCVSVVRLQRACKLFEVSSSVCRIVFENRAKTRDIVGLGTMLASLKLKLRLSTGIRTNSPLTKRWVGPFFQKCRKTKPFCFISQGASCKK